MQRFPDGEVWVQVQPSTARVQCPTLVSQFRRHVSGRGSGRLRRECSLLCGLSQDEGDHRESRGSRSQARGITLPKQVIIFLQGDKSFLLTWRVYLGKCGRPSIFSRDRKGSQEEITSQKQIFIYKTIQKHLIQHIYITYVIQ